MSYEFYYDHYLNQSSSLKTQEVPNIFKIVGTKSVDPGKTSDNQSEVIFKDTIKSDLQISVTHAYANIQNKLSTIWNNLETNVQEWLGKFRTSTAELNQLLGTITNATADTSNAYLKYVGIADYFKTFDGTQISIPLSLSTRVYSRYEKDSKSESESFKNPKEIIKRLSEYFIGNSNGAGRRDVPTGTFIHKDKKDNTITGVIASTTDVEAYVYGAPHGYTSIPNTATEVWSVDGTLSLFYGPIQISQLVLTGFDFRFSKEVGLYKISSDSALVEAPLYADLSLTLIPSTIFTRSTVDALLT